MVGIGCPAIVRTHADTNVCRSLLEMRLENPIVKVVLPVRMYGSAKIIEISVSLRWYEFLGEWSI